MTLKSFFKDMRKNCDDTCKIPYENTFCIDIRVVDEKECYIIFKDHNGYRICREISTSNFTSYRSKYAELFLKSVLPELRKEYRTLEVFSKYKNGSTASHVVVFLSVKTNEELDLKLNIYGLCLQCDITFGASEASVLIGSIRNKIFAQNINLEKDEELKVINFKEYIDGLTDKEYEKLHNDAVQIQNDIMEKYNKQVDLLSNCEISFVVLDAKMLKFKYIGYMKNGVPTRMTSYGEDHYYILRNISKFIADEDNTIKLKYKVDSNYVVPSYETYILSTSMFFSSSAKLEKSRVRTANGWKDEYQLIIPKFPAIPIMENGNCEQIYEAANRYFKDEAERDAWLLKYELFK